MNEFQRFLKSLDFFGAPLLQYIDKNKFLYRSVFGGIATFLIFSASIAYSLVILYEWQTNQLNPKIQHSVYVSDFQLLNLDYEVLKFCYWKASPDMIDPFESKVIIPIVTYTINSTMVSSVVLHLSNETNEFGIQFIVPNMSLGFSRIGEDLFTTSEMYIQFVKCQSSLLPDGEYCASQDTIQQFYTQPLNTIIMTIKFKTIDSKDKIETTSVEEFLIQIEPQFCYTLNTYLQSTIFEINDAFLFADSTEYEYINGAKVQAQTNSVDYCTIAFGYETYALVYVVMSANSTKSIYEYPHASDICANIGSIISLLFMVRYIVVFLNSYYLQQSVIDELISFYYPQYENIKIYKNWRGVITRVQYKYKFFDAKELRQFTEQLNTIRRQIKLKLSVVNMLYEISRIYFLLRSFTSPEEIRKTHLIGIRFDFITPEIIPDSDEFRQCSSRSDINFLKKQFLDKEDMNLLSLDGRFGTKEDQIPNEIQSINKDYYIVNRVF